MEKYIKFANYSNPKSKDTIKEDALEIISSINKLAKAGLVKANDLAFAKRVEDYIRKHNAVATSELVGLRRVLLRYD
jgi:hypothetical protein